MTFISRAGRYVLRKRIRTLVLLVILTIVSASMLATTVSYTHLTLPTTSRV